MRKLLSPLKPILYAYLRSEAGKKMIISLLTSLAKQTDNSLDDQAVAFIKERVWNHSSSGLR